MTYYNSFLLKNIDLSPLGINKSENCPYFCTPAGAKIIGWEGVDGIHYIFIRGFGETVFSVSPMNSYNDYVHPIARSFKDFLALLTLSGGAAVLEQARGLSRKDFCKLSKQALSGDESVNRAIAAIKKNCRLPEISDPYDYINSLQSEFDYSKIRYTQDYYDLDMNPPAIEELPWKIYFGGGFFSKSRKKQQPCREIAIGKDFFFMDKYHLVPAVYVGSEGIVADICIRSEKTDIQAFINQYNSISDSGKLNRFKERELESINPLQIQERITLVVNSHVLYNSSGYFLTLNPCLEDGECNDIYSEAAAEHYGLDKSFGWNICRLEFPWGDSGLKPKSIAKGFNLAIRLKNEPKAYASDVIDFKDGTATVINPITQKIHTVTITDSKRNEMDFQFNDGMIHPKFVTGISYQVSPELPENIMQLYDLDPTDPSKPKEAVGEMIKFQPQATIGIIGGADGPTAVFVSSKKESAAGHTALSSLSFEKNKEIRWLAVFKEDNAKSAEVSLLN